MVLSIIIFKRCKYVAKLSILWYIFPIHGIKIENQLHLRIGWKVFELLPKIRSKAIILERVWSYFERYSSLIVKCAGFLWCFSINNSSFLQLIRIFGAKLLQKIYNVTLKTRKKFVEESLLNEQMHHWKKLVEGKKLGANSSLNLRIKTFGSMGHQELNELYSMEWFQQHIACT